MRSDFEACLTIGVSNVADESDRDGMRIVVEVKKGSDPQLILNQLYKLTDLKTSFSCNFVAVVNDGGARCRTMGLKEMLLHFLDFRHVTYDTHSPQRQSWDLPPARTSEFRILLVASTPLCVSCITPQNPWFNYSLTCFHDSIKLYLYKNLFSSIEAHTATHPLHDGALFKWFISCFKSSSCCKNSAAQRQHFRFTSLTILQVPIHFLNLEPGSDTVLLHKHCFSRLDQLVEIATWYLHKMLLDVQVVYDFLSYRCACLVAGVRWLQKERNLIYRKLKAGHTLWKDF